MCSRGLHTSFDIGLDVENQQGIVQAGPEQQPAPAALALLDGHPPALVIFRLERPAGSTACPGLDPRPELFEHLLAVLLEARLLQSHGRRSHEHNVHMTKTRVLLA